MRNQDTRGPDDGRWLRDALADAVDAPGDVGPAPHEEIVARGRAARRRRRCTIGAVVAAALAVVPAAAVADLGGGGSASRTSQVEPAASPAKAPPGMSPVPTAPPPPRNLTEHVVYTGTVAGRRFQLRREFGTVTVDGATQYCDGLSVFVEGHEVDGGGSGCGSGVPVPGSYSFSNALIGDSSLYNGGFGQLARVVVGTVPADVVKATATGTDGRTQDAEIVTADGIRYFVAVFPKGAFAEVGALTFFDASGRTLSTMPNVFLDGGYK